MDFEDGLFVAALSIIGVLAVTIVIVVIASLFAGDDLRSKCVGYETRIFTTDNGITAQYDPSCK